MRESDKVHSSWLTKLLDNPKYKKLMEKIIRGEKIEIKIGKKTYKLE